MTTKTAEEMLADASAWWDTAIIDIHPGKIAIRGYPIEELIGRVRFSRHDLADAARRTAVARPVRPPRSGDGARRRPRAARAVHRDRPHGGHLRPAGQRRDGLGDQRARRHPRRRGPAVHGALSRDRRRSRARREISWRPPPTSSSATAMPARRSFPASAIASTRSIRGPLRSSRWSRKAGGGRRRVGTLRRDRPRGRGRHLGDQEAATSR